MGGGPGTRSRVVSDPRRAGVGARFAFPPGVRAALAVRDHELVVQDPLIAVVDTGQTPLTVAGVVAGAVVGGAIATKCVGRQEAHEPSEAIVIGGVDEL